MKSRISLRYIVIAALCATVGAAGGIASGGAAKKKSTKAKTTSTAKRFDRGFRGGRPPFGGPGGFHGPKVHEESVVLNKAGTAFITETEDSGIVQSVSGDQLTIKEGTPTVTYKTVTLTIASDAKIYRNGPTAAKLSDFKSGDHVRVSSSSDGTVVMGGDKTHGPGRDGDHFGHGDGPPMGPPPAGSPQGSGSAQ